MVSQLILRKAEIYVAVFWISMLEGYACIENIKLATFIMDKQISQRKGYVITGAIVHKGI